MAYINQFQNGIAAGDFLMGTGQGAYAAGVEARRPGKMTLAEGLANVTGYPSTSLPTTAALDRYIHVGNSQSQSGHGLYRIGGTPTSTWDSLGYITENSSGGIIGAYGARNLLLVGDYYTWLYPLSASRAAIGRIKKAEADNSNNWTAESSFTRNVVEYDKRNSEETSEGGGENDIYFPAIVFLNEIMLFTTSSATNVGSTEIKWVNMNDATPTPLKLIDVPGQVKAMTFQSWTLRIYTDDKVYILSRETLGDNINAGTEVTQYDVEVDLGIRSVDGVFNDGNTDTVVANGSFGSIMLAASGTDRQIIKKSYRMDDWDTKFLFRRPQFQFNGKVGVKYQDLLFLATDSDEGGVYSIGKEDPDYRDTIFNSIWYGESKIDEVNQLWIDGNYLYVQYEGVNSQNYLGRLDLSPWASLYQTQGEWRTSVFDFSENGFQLTQLNLKANIPENTQVQIQYRVDGSDWATYDTFTYDADNTYKHRSTEDVEGDLLQLKIALSTTDTAVTPEIIGLAFTVKASHIND